MRAALAGYGLAGRVFHAPLIAATDGLDVSVVVTSNAERAAQARADVPGARVVGSVDEAWEHADLLVVATPNRHHADLALAAIDRGLPVVIDKPLAVTAADAERVLAAGGQVTVFQNRRWDGDFICARRLVDEGALGDVVRFESRFERLRPSPKAGWRELADPAEGGGQLLDLGAHLVDQAIALFGVPRRVYAEAERRREGAQVDDDAFVALEHEGGVRAHLWMSAVAALAGPRLRVSGTRAGLAIDGLDPQEGQLAGGLRPGDAGYGERDAPARLVDAGGARDVPVDRGRYADFYAGVRDWLAADAPLPVDPLDSLTALRVLEAARRSAQTHTVIDLEEIDV